MNNYETVKIKDISQYRKDFITIDDSAKYKRCRVQLHRRGIIVRDELLGKNIKTKRQRVCEENNFLVAEMDAKFGGYGVVPKELDGAIVSSHYYLFKLDENKIKPEYLSVLIDTNIIQDQIKAKGSTNYSRVSPSEVLEFEIPCPSIDEQKRIVYQYLSAKEIILELSAESSAQSSFLSKLRQAILQEAIEGKLTADWRREQERSLAEDAECAKISPGELRELREKDPDYSARALLESIREEKKLLAKDTKGAKREKTLPPIKPEEVPFELPEGWVWARLGEVAEGFQYGSSSKSKKVGKIPVLRMGNIQAGKIDWHDLVYTDNIEEINQYNLKKGDLLFNRTNSRELVGKTALFDGLYQAIFAGYLIRFILLGNIHPEYGNIIMNSSFHREWCDINKTDAIGQSNINATKLRNFIYSLPPLAEQKVIVSRIEKLLVLLDELEAQISERKEQTDILLQTVLKEAFEPAEKLKQVESELREQTIAAEKNEVYDSVNSFQQLQIVGTVVDMINQQNQRQGEMVIAKYLYLLSRIYGIRTGFKFGKWHFGPYDPAIKEVINNQTYFFRSGKAGFQTIGVQKTDQLFNYKNPQVDRIREKFPEILSLFSKYKDPEQRAHEVELLATVLKAVEDSGKTDIDSVYYELAKWQTDISLTGYSSKAEKFNEAEVRDCLGFVKSMGWVG